ncbi:DUF4365 domain-containing protein [Amycolatopsis thermoflava]|uniref:DUF4365 domain-containing protein n=1 Tax=Amycolatopsis thermoflava TaxID=84480 RepID=UPI003EB697D3
MANLTAVAATPSSSSHKLNGSVTIKLLAVHQSAFVLIHPVVGCELHETGDARLAATNERATSGVAPVIADTFTACMEQLQDGYVFAVAATAGCTVEVLQRDTYGLDVLIIRKGRTASEEEISVYAQLKSTTTLRPDPSAKNFSFQFKKRKHFDHLAKPRKGIKAILVVMATCPSQAGWTKATHDSLELQHCCYWVSLEGLTVKPEVQKPTVHVPTGNIFDAAALTQILDKLDRAEPLR